MPLTEKIQRDLTDAMKRKDPFRLGVLRMMKNSLRNKEIEKRSSLSDAEAIQVLQSMVKQRTESMEQFQAGGRPELADKERREREIIESYLPAAVSNEEIEAVIVAVIGDQQAGGPKDMGKVMKETMSRLQATGKTVDGKRVSSMVRTKLEELSR